MKIRNNENVIKFSTNEASKLPAMMELILQFKKRIKEINYPLPTLIINRMKSLEFYGLLAQVMKVVSQQLLLSSNTLFILKTI